MLKNHTHRLALALALSALLHLVVVFYNNEEAQSERFDSADSVIVSVQLIAGNVKSVEAINKQQHKPVIQQPVKNRVLSMVSDGAEQPLKKAGMDEALAEVKENSGAVMQQEAAASGKAQEDEFLKLVYVEISKHKAYPYQAKHQRREGKVKINFKLHPDGHVSEIIVMESSHFNALDRAAQQAVESISPFLMAANYLQAETEFNVDIDYRLN